MLRTPIFDKPLRVVGLVALSAALAVGILGPTSIANSAPAYHKVPLAELLGRNTTTTQLGSTLFRYAWKEFYENEDNGDLEQPVLLKRNCSSCKSITLVGGARKEDANEEDPLLTLFALREGGSAYSESLPSSSVKHFPSIALRPGKAFQIQVHVGLKDSDAGGFVYLNGFGMCSTSDGAL